MENRALAASLVVCALLGRLEQSFAAPATTLSARQAVSTLRRIAPRATLAQVKAVLPRGTKYRWTGATPSLYSWTWNVLHLSNTRGGSAIEGVIIFANDRARYARLRPAKNAAERDAIEKAATAWREGDIVHSAMMFLGPESAAQTEAAIERHTRRQMNRVIALLGRPSKKSFERPNQGPGDQGWTASWKLSRGRSVYFADTLALLGSETRPSLELRFPYSQMYRS